MEYELEMLFRRFEFTGRRSSRIWAPHRHRARGRRCSRRAQYRGRWCSPGSMCRFRAPCWLQSAHSRSILGCRTLIARYQHLFLYHFNAKMTKKVSNQVFCSWYREWTTTSLDRGGQHSDVSLWSGVTFLSAVVHMVSEGGLSLVCLPQLLKGGMQLVWTVQGQEKIVSRVVDTHVWRLRQFGAKQVAVLNRKSNWPWSSALCPPFVAQCCWQQCRRASSGWKPWRPLKISASRKIITGGFV